jgi:hypothetical protein
MSEAAVRQSTADYRSEREDSKARACKIDLDDNKVFRNVEVGSVAGNWGAELAPPRHQSTPQQQACTLSHANTIACISSDTFASELLLDDIMRAYWCHFVDVMHCHGSPQRLVLATPAQQSRRSAKPRPIFSGTLFQYPVSQILALRGFLAGSDQPA